MNLLMWMDQSLRALPHQSLALFSPEGLVYLLPLLLFQYVYQTRLKTFWETTERKNLCCKYTMRIRALTASMHLAWSKRSHAGYILDVIGMRRATTTSEPMLLWDTLRVYRRSNRNFVRRILSLISKGSVTSKALPTRDKSMRDRSSTSLRHGWRQK